ncbi:MAG: GAF domain-containing protein [Desulfobacteraceae bacterium]|nr:MAG: GAF domain-containing protein [Desulfobacteraceae bacterium]
MEYSPNHELKDLIELVSNVNEAFTAALFLYNPPRDRLFLRSYHTLSLQVNPKTTIQPGDSLIGWVAKNKQPVNVAQFDRDNRNLKLYLRDEGIKSFMAVPVGDAGVLSVDSKRNYVFTDKNQKILQDFARVIYQVLQTQTLCRQELKQRRLLNFIYRINALSRENHDLQEYYQKVLNACRIFSNTDAAFLTLLPRKGDRYTVVASEGKLFAPMKKNSIPIDMGLTGWVIKEKKPLVRREMKPRIISPIFFSRTILAGSFVLISGYPSLFLINCTE